MQQLQLSEATAAQRRLFFHAVDATDGLTAVTGLTGTGFLSKNGATPVATSASLSELNATNMPGRYYIEFTAAELNTVGIIEFRYKAAACAEVIARAQIVSFDPYDAVRMGLTALPNAAAEAAGGLYTRGTGAGQINQQTNGQIDANLERLRNAVVNILVSGRVDASVGAMAADVVTAAAIANAAIDAATFAAGAIDAAAIATGAIDADAIAANAITAAKIAADAITAAKVADGTIDAATFAAGAINAAAIANGAIDAATFAAGAIDAAAIAADAITAAKVAAGTIDAATFAAGAIDAAALATDAVDEIVDQVWDEDIVAAHGAASAAGLLLRALGGTISTRSNNPTLDALLGISDVASQNLAEQLLRTETFAELTTVVGATPTVEDLLMWLLMSIRNKATDDGTTVTISNNAETVIAKATIANVGGVATREEFVAGP